MEAQTLKPINLEGKQHTAWYRLTDKTTTEVFYGGAAGGGKSFLGCLWHIDRRVRYPKSRGLIGRAKIANLEQSTLITYFKVCEALGYRFGIDYVYNSQKHTIAWSNGSVTILKDLFYYPSDPDFISLGSTEYTDAFIDEGTEVVQRAFELVKSRIRWMIHDYGLIPKILVTCNPSPGWIKDNYISDPITAYPIELKPHQKFIHALVDDNPDKEFVAIYKSNLVQMNSDYDRERLLYGNWDVDRDITNPFAHQYDKYIHESEEAKFDHLKQLFIAIDFNLNPFAVTFWHHWQDVNGYHWHGFDEAEIANGSIEKMVELIDMKYGPYLFNAVLTGDALGKNRNIAEKDNASNYLLLQRGLKLSSHQLKVPANPTHANSRPDVNKLLALTKSQPERFDFKLNPKRMPNTCRDFRNVQCDASGEIVKGNRKDLNQRADYLDTGRYFINLTAKSIILRMWK